MVSANQSLQVWLIFQDVSARLVISLTSVYSYVKSYHCGRANNGLLSSENLSILIISITIIISAA